MAIISCQTIPPVSWLPWPDPAAQTSLSNSLLVFRCALDSAFASPPLHWLTPTEWQRADRFHQSIDRQRFVLGRSLLRYVAGQLADQAPSQIDLRLGPLGKPAWVNRPGWHVNLAHAGNWVILALAPVPVGVDVELIQPAIDHNLLLLNTFSKEEQTFIAQQPAPQRAFYVGWTRKEALVKATGLGISDELPQVPMLTGTHTIPDALLGAAGYWNLVSFAVDEHHPAAVAWQRPLPISDLSILCYSV